MLVPQIMSNRTYMDDFFDNFLFPLEKTRDFGKMRCDIYEKDNVYYLEVDIPGFDKSNVSIEFDNEYLTIIAEKNIEDYNDDKEKRYVCKERNYGKYKRAFYIKGIDKEKIEAEFVNGVLTVIMPKKIEDSNLNKKIEIK